MSFSQCRSSGTNAQAAASTDSAVFPHHQQPKARMRDRRWRQEKICEVPLLSKHETARKGSDGTKDSIPSFSLHQLLREPPSLRQFSKSFLCILLYQCPFLSQTHEPLPLPLSSQKSLQIQAGDPRCHCSLPELVLTKGLRFHAISIVAYN